MYCSTPELPLIPYIRTDSRGILSCLCIFYYRTEEYSMKTKKLACLTACTMLASAVWMLPAQAAGTDGGVTDPLFGTLPDWVPHDFVSAMQFLNTHGKSYVSDGIICLVRPMAHFRTDDYQYEIGGSMALVNTPASTQPKIYELEIPEKPDPEDAEAVKAYEDFCDSVGNYTHDYSVFERYAECRTQTALEVELFRVADGEDLIVTWLEKEGGELNKKEEFRFGSADGNMYETDIWGWLPDCDAEYKAFLDHYGRASVYDNYIVYCADVNGSTGETLKMTQESDDGCEIKQVLESDCIPFLLNYEDGTGVSSVLLYKPVKDGTVEVKWTIERDIPGEEPFQQTVGLYEAKDDCAFVYDNSEHKKQSIVVTFLDQDTGEMIDTSSGQDVLMRQSGVGDPIDPYVTKTFKITSNPFRFDVSSDIVQTDDYFYYPKSNGGYYKKTKFETTEYDAYQTCMTCKMKWNPSGDLNGTDDFTTADITLLKKLLSGQDVKIKDWNAADFCRDNTLNAADLTMMKRAYILKHTKIEKPDTVSDDYNSFYVIGDNLKLYAGPGDDYTVIDTFELGAFFFERGYNKGNDDWVYVGNGWIKTKCDNSDAPNIRFTDLAYDKPVIYLYPEQETDVHVELELTTSTLATTYPRYNDGWDVTAYPDGTLLNKADGTHHRYLFWDSTDSTTSFDFSKGFCVAGSETEQFLKEKLTYMGLTEEEMNEFIVYWLPRMEHNAYNLIAFQGDAYTDSAKLSITPAPDSLCRVFMAYIPLDEAREIEPQQLETFERKGFSVVEWGGTEIGARK